MSNKRSPIWLYFTIINNDTKICQCDICKQQLSFKHSASNLKKHFKRKHPSVELVPEKSQTENIPSTSGLKRSLPYDAEICENDAQASTSKKSKLDTVLLVHSDNKNIVQKKISSFIPKKITGSIKAKIDADLLGLFIFDYQHFSVVQDRGFKKFVYSLNPSYELPNRHTISNTLIPLVYEKRFEEAKIEMKKVLNVCLTTDCWTSAKVESFMAVTCHFIDDFKMKSVLLSCDILEENHTAVNLAAKLKEVVQQWDLEKKVILTVSDNAINIKKAITDELGWKFFGCFAHTLNLIVHDALKLVQTIIEKVKKIVSHFRRSSRSNSKLLNFQKQAGIEVPKKLIQDVSTRWNSTFYMMERFIELENCIRSTVGLLDESLPQLSSEEWTIMKELCEILKYFEEATKSVSGESYISASLVIVLNRGLLNVCDKLKKNQFNQMSKSVLNCLENGLRHRLGNVEFSNTLAICTFLDPRFKTFAFKHVGAVDSIKKIVINLVTEMVTKKNEQKITQNDPASSENEQPKENVKLSLWDCLDEVVTESKPKTSSSSSRAIMEVQRYLEDDVLDRHGNPLEWWKQNQYNYPYLIQLVQQKCCALATSVPCERLFSKAGNILNERRTRLSADKLKKLLFLNTNAQQT